MISQRVFAMAQRHFRLCTNPKLSPWPPSPWPPGLLLAACLLAVAACDENPVGPTVPLNQRFTFAPGEVATLDGTSSRVQFIRVSGDSRCPADVVCIQGGDAIVHVRVADDNQAADYELHTGDGSRASATHRGVRIELVELRPYPFSNRTIQGGDYRATLIASAGRVQ